MKKLDELRERLESAGVNLASWTDSLIYHPYPEYDPGSVHVHTAFSRLIVLLDSPESLPRKYKALGLFWKPSIIPHGEGWAHIQLQRLTDIIEANLDKAVALGERELWLPEEAIVYVGAL